MEPCTHTQRWWHLMLRPCRLPKWHNSVAHGRAHRLNQVSSSTQQFLQPHMRSHGFCRVVPGVWTTHFCIGTLDKPRSESWHRSFPWTAMMWPWLWVQVILAWPEVSWSGDGWGRFMFHRQKVALLRSGWCCEVQFFGKKTVVYWWKTTVDDVDDRSSEVVHISNFLKFMMLMKLLLKVKMRRVVFWGMARIQQDIVNPFQ